MGNSFGNLPSGDGGNWRFYLTENIPGLLVVVNAHYSEAVPQRIQITGPIALNLTLMINNATIEVEGTDHQVCLIGRGNNVVIKGSKITLRLEGDSNTIGGAGTGVSLYTDHEVTLGEDLLLATRQRLTDDQGNVVDGVPPNLILTRPTLRNAQRPANGDTSESLQCTFSPLPLGPTNQPPSSSTINGAASQTSAGERSAGSSSSGSNTSVGGKRERDDDDEDGVKSKKSKTD